MSTNASLYKTTIRPGGDDAQVTPPTVRIFMRNGQRVKGEIVVCPPAAIEGIAAHKERARRVREGAVCPSGTRGTVSRGCLCDFCRVATL